MAGPVAPRCDRLGPDRVAGYRDLPDHLHARRRAAWRSLGTTIALGVAPIATGLCAQWWTRERLARGWVIASVAAILGCAILLDPWAAQQVRVVGVGVALISGVCYGVYTVAAKRFLQAGAPALPATSLTLLMAGLALSPVLVAHPDHLTDPNSMLLVGWIALVGTTGAYAVFVYGLHRTTASIAGTLSLAEPMLAAALGIIVLGERLTPSAMIGCLLLLVALIAVPMSDAMGAQSFGLPIGPSRLARTAPTNLGDLVAAWPTVDDGRTLVSSVESVQLSVADSSDRPM